MIILEAVQRGGPDWQWEGHRLGLVHMPETAQVTEGSSGFLLCLQSQHMSLASGNRDTDANIFQNLQPHLGSSTEPRESVQQKSMSVFRSLLA